MKIFGRFVVFALTFVLGTQLAQFVSTMNTALNPTNLPAVEEPDPFSMKRSSMPTGITVTYAGMQKNEQDGTYLKFIVHNGTNAPVVYGAKGSYWPFPEVLIDGNKQPDQYRCGSGSSAFSIEPKMSAEFRVREVEFDNVPKKNAMISVGFYLGDPRSDFGSEIYSESFILPESFRDSIKEWHK